jgi:hypothetical protein
MGIIQGAIPRDAVRTTVIPGGAVGDHSVGGVKPRDRLVSVLFVDFTDATGGATDLTSEFTITADETINNAGGTDTTAGHLIVTWLSVA